MARSNVTASPSIPRPVVSKPLRALSSAHAAKKKAVEVALNRLSYAYANCQLVELASDQEIV
ncbi:MAG: hypothetical protein AAGF32_06270, partial [Pseudomonadota bacterium]